MPRRRKTISAQLQRQVSTCSSAPSSHQRRQTRHPKLHGHLVTGLSSCNPKFPLHLWDRLIPHDTLTLNLLRPSCLNPRLSAESQLKGAFDYNRTPLAPPDNRVVVHESPGNHHTWNLHDVDGWYLGPAPEHYQCHF